MCSSKDTKMPNKAAAVGVTIWLYLQWLTIVFYDPFGFRKIHTSEVNRDVRTNTSANFQSFTVALVSAISEGMSYCF